MSPPLRGTLGRVLEVDLASGTARPHPLDVRRGDDAMDPAALDEVCRRHGVLLLVQFGSTVSGAVHERSDLDLAYYQSFLELGSLAILDPTFARQIASAAGLRDRIAHVIAPT